ncbi:hypothetical protein ACOTTU_11675 [Roseobacter sp. EG26]|uniref:hypothetical protein n=1 Tax=Roseobacter sp. EG26 TaxID=3412477 RepID=UPI003CE4F9C8
MEPISALLPLINMLRPTKSPHLLIFLSGIVCIELFAVVGAGELANQLFHFPIYAILTIALILSFYYRPPEISGLHHNPARDSGAETEEQPQDLSVEVEHQFKFARAFCLVAGIVSLYFFAGQLNEDLFVYTAISYVIIIAHLMVFVFYMIFRTLKEEGMHRYSIYQIGFITGIVLIALSLSYTKMSTSATEVFFVETDANGNEIVSESDQSADVKVDVWARNNWAFYCTVWLVYFSFWVGRLRHFVRINIVDPAR